MKKTESKEIRYAAIALVLIVVHVITLIIWGITPIATMIILPACISMLIIVLVAGVYLLVKSVIRIKTLTGKQMIMRTVLLMIMSAGLLYFWCTPGFLCNFYLRNFGLRMKAKWCGGVDPLQEWAKQMLLKSREEQITEPDKDFIKRGLWTDQVRSFCGSMGRVSYYDEGRESHIAIYYGSALTGHWGVLVGEPTFNAKIYKDDEYTTIFKWRDGVYSYFGE